MKQVFKTPSGFVTEDMPLPVPLPGGVLVRVSRSLISPGTETMGLRGGSTTPSASEAESVPDWRETMAHRLALVRTGLHSLRARGVAKTWEATRNYLASEMGDSLPEAVRPKVLWPTGYSAAGIVVECGRDRELPMPGARVACAGAGYACHAEYITVPKRLCVPIPAGVSDEAAAFTTLGAIAMHGVRRAEATFGESLVVIGLGLVGLLAAQIARAAGYAVLGLDLDEARRARAEALGIPTLPCEDARDPVGPVKAVTGGGADRVLLCLATDSSKPTNDAFRMSRRKGRVVLVGVSGMNLERAAMFKGEVDFVISTSYGPGRYDPNYEERGEDYPAAYVRWTEQRNMAEFLRLVDTGAVRVDTLVDERVSVDEAPAAYQRLLGDGPRAVGILIDYPARPEAPAAARPGDSEPITLETKSLRSDSTEPLVELSERAPRLRAPILDRPIKVALIGAGGFVQGVHAPLLAESEDFALIGLVNSRRESTEQAAGALGVDGFDSVESLLAAKPDLVLIGTRHDSHAALVEQALDAGAQVFCEKPLAIDRPGLERIRAALGRHPEALLTVGFNRRHAPIARALKEALECDPAPIMVYRVAAGHLPEGHWVRDATVSGGRIIGEGCHMLDLFAFLLDDARPVSLSVAGDGSPERDNLAVTIRYEGGAVGVLIYAREGGPELGKERLEVFSRGRSFALDDFRALTGPGLAERGEQDKGFRRQWQELAKAVRGGDNELPAPSSIFATTELSFLAEERASGAPAVVGTVP